MAGDDVTKSVKLPRDAYAAVEAAADAEHKSVHAWMRGVILEAARTESSTPVVEAFAGITKALARLEAEDRTRVLDGLDAFFQRPSRQKVLP